MKAKALIHVTDETHSRIRFGSAMYGETLGEFTDRAVTWYLQEHRGEIAERFEDARKTLGLD